MLITYQAGDILHLILDDEGIVMGADVQNQGNTFMLLRTQHDIEYKDDLNIVLSQWQVDLINSHDIDLKIFSHLLLLLKLKILK